MTIININGKEFELEKMSDTAKVQVATIQFVDAEIARLNSQLAVFQTAKIAYGRALDEQLAVVG
jgi:hypothetical protein